MLCWPTGSTARLARTHPWTDRWRPCESASVSTFDIRNVDKREVVEV
jgi:hypothetical protein